MYDVLIAGAGPAGATAAALLAGQGRSVLLIEQDAIPRQAQRTVWVNACVAALVESLGSNPDEVLSAPFSDVTFYDGELQKSASPNLTQPAGYLLERSAFEDALVQAATRAGAELMAPCTVAGVKLAEEGVEVNTSDAQVFSGRVLLLAAGNKNPLIDQVLPAHVLHPGHRQTAQVEGTDPAAPDSVQAVTVILGLDREGGFGLLIRRGQSLRMAATAACSADSVRRMLVNLCGNLAAKGIVTVDLTAQARQARVWQIASSAALEMDSHVGKHCLVIGDAGGFVAAGSDEGIYPAMWSAQIAAGVVTEALASRHSQDTLMQFDAKWRIAMAEYLRPPNTDVQFLLPLIFSNQPMADRMAAAFFAGQNI